MFIIMKINLKYGLGILCFTVFVYIFISTKCGNISIRPTYPHPDTRNLEEIDCVINNQDNVIDCKKEGEEIFMPFSFIKKYFDVYGQITTIDGETKRFEFSHSFGKINPPKPNYDPKGIYMYFENYNVESRDRVKCISGSTGVPITTQWDKQGLGWYYATQIAQFGLSHYSKNLTDPEPRRKIIEDGESNQTSHWITSKNSTIIRTYSKIYGSIVNFTATHQFDSSVSITNLDYILDLVLSVDVVFKPNSSLSVTLQNRETRRLYNLFYIFADFSLSVQSDNIYYGIGTDSNKWKHLTRDLFIDLMKGMSTGHYSDRKRKIRRTELKIVSISFSGQGAFDNLTLSTTEHLAHFFDAAEWLLLNQNQDGGYPIPVKRKLGPGFDDLNKGWLSAMSQGHAISLLSRAYFLSGQPRYLTAALNALKPFRIPSYQGGVLATFLGKYVWYEEYPTTPHSFVLNGFIYSLLGLYDLFQIAPKEQSKEALALFDQGMVSLKKLLTLFDTGSGTTYDLRHFTLGTAPNLARWDYHATHVNQLLLLATIDSDPIISQTGSRWKDYMFGKRAPHN